MVLYLTPMFGPPVPEKAIPLPDLAQTAAAAHKTLDLLAKHGLDTSYADADITAAGEITRAYAEDPAGTSRALTKRRIDNMTPSSLRALDAQLKRFSASIVEDAAHVRNYVTNKLLEESENPDPRIRIKALELLGRISDVGLFADKREVQVTHTTSGELRDSLRAKLSRLVGSSSTEMEDAEILAEPLTADKLDAAWDDADG